jgi:hypothetical protein
LNAPEAFDFAAWLRGVMDPNTLDAHETLVLLKLVRHAGATGHAWPGMTALQEGTKISRSSIKRALHELERRGLIARAAPGATFAGDTRPESQRMTCVYRLPLRPPTAALKATRVPTEPGSPQNPVPAGPGGGSTSDPRGGSGRTPNYSGNFSRNYSCCCCL